MRRDLEGCWGFGIPIWCCMIILVGSIWRFLGSGTGVLERMDGQESESELHA